MLVRDHDVFYKMRLAIDEQGINVITKELVSIHESECWHWCIEKTRAGYIRSYQREDESLLQAAKRSGEKIHKVAKVGSRVAFKTLPDAFDHLMMLKRKQINHMRREIAILEDFTKKADGLDIESINPDSHGDRVIPDTHEVVHGHYRFD